MVHNVTKYELILCESLKTGGLFVVSKIDHSNFENSHCSLTIVDFQGKEMRYYDSLKRNGI